MQTLTEKRVFGDRSGSTAVFLATELGLVAVEVSGEQIGEFSLRYRDTVADVAVADDVVAIATDSGVHTATINDDDRSFTRIAHADAVAIAADLDGFLVAGPDGSVCRVGFDGGIDTIGHTEGVRAIDPPLVAAADGVYRIEDASLTGVGLSDVRDVVGRGVPFAATASGLYTLGNGWMKDVDGSFELVAGDGHESGHAVGADGLFAYSGHAWEPIDSPVAEPIVALAHGAGLLVAVTSAGRLCVDAGDGWRHQLLGVTEARSIAIAADRNGV